MVVSMGMSWVDQWVELETCTYEHDKIIFVRSYVRK